MLDGGVEIVLREFGGDQIVDRRQDLGWRQRTGAECGGEEERRLIEPALPDADAAEQAQRLRSRAASG